MRGDNAWFMVKDLLVWTRRRVYLLGVSVVFSIPLPIMFGKAIIDRAHGRGFFADPRGKPGLFLYVWELVAFIWGVGTVNMKPPSELAIEAAKSTPTPNSGDGIMVKMTDDYVEFQPKEGGDGGAVGVIIIPGALVSTLAYSFLARSLARRGHNVFVLRLPFGLAWYAWTLPGKIIEREQEEGAPKKPTKWVLVGHSLGTVCMERFTVDKPDCVDCVVFTGGGRKTTGKLAKLELPSLVVRGSRDPFTPEKDIQEGLKNLPEGTEVCVVEGGNHRGFASYTRQPLDWEATITQEEQQRITTEAIAEFIKRRVV